MTNREFPTITQEFINALEEAVVKPLRPDDYKKGIEQLAFRCGQLDVIDWLKAIHKRQMEN
jgi:hypothetical protein